jgi:FkbM family methyltransferase
MEWHGQSKSTGGGSELPLDQLLYEKHFLGKTYGTAIECGANDGLYLSTCLAFEELGWSVINIEASLPNYNKLAVNRPKSQNYPVALWDKNERVYVENFAGDNGGADKIRSCHTEFSKRFPRAGEHIIPSVRYDCLIRQPIDLFVLDVEGAELNVIAGMANTRYWPGVICVEYPHCGLENITDALGLRYWLDYHDDLNAVFVGVP